MGSSASNLRKGKLRECSGATDTSENGEGGVPAPGPHITNLNHEQDLSHSLRQEQERVSNLSDSILVQILREEHEFLQQFQHQEPTSNLSDQIPSASPNNSTLEVLHIDDTSFFAPETDMFFYDFRRFEKFLDGLIPQLRTLPSITSLIFSCRYSYDSQYVQSLIYTVLERNVQKLDISYFLKGFALPLCIFECSTVMELNLHMRSCKLDVRTPIHHPNLQVFRVSGIVFANCQDVIFDFPALKVFKLKDCTWSSNVQVVRINIPSAERFVLKHCEGEDEYSLSIVEIWAQSVTKLTLATSQLVELIQPPNPDLVEKASIGFGIELAKALQLPKEMYLRACGILEQLNGVKCLKLHKDTMLVRSLFSFSNILLLLTLENSCSR
ncbi:hypothetical protein L6164_022731 [Bauhinia variegata]|uniref:Uncharacterized protein n=1 Tax=Bauhinia variegata TaxID=167791 RepID=A0ACB9MG56_BAUVA|nr:hypothetical protein L6164_022731 [Bauhinia variegata]